MTFRISPRVAYQTIAGEEVLVDLAGARVLGLNGTGALVWSMIGDHDEEAIARALVDRFDVEPETARFDVHEFVGTLVQRGLLTQVP